MKYVAPIFVGYTHIHTYINASCIYHFLFSKIKSNEIILSGNKGVNPKKNS